LRFLSTKISNFWTWLYPEQQKFAQGIIKTIGLCCSFLFPLGHLGGDMNEKTIFAEESILTSNPQPYD